MLIHPRAMHQEAGHRSLLISPEFPYPTLTPRLGGCGAYKALRSNNWN